MFRCVFFLSFLVVSCFSQSCDRTPVSSDTIPTNPGVTESAAKTALAGRQLRSTCNEVTRSFTQGSTPPVNNRTNCPHLRTDLTPFETKFPTLTAGQDVTLGTTDKLLLSKCSFNVPLGRLTIPAGAVLVLNDQPMSFQFREISIAPGGSFLAGSETCRLYSSYNITFLGNRANSSPAVTGAPSKGLVCDGLVEIHAKQFHPTWTRLAVSARAGDTIIFLQDPVNWEVGQKVLLTTTTFYDCPAQWASWCQPCLPWQSGQSICNAPTYFPHQNEVRTIVAVSNLGAATGYVVQLDSALTYTHYSGSEYTGEVALLSRRFLFYGEQSGDGFGGHTMVETSLATGKFSGVQGDNMGQLNTLARYPFHFHLLAESGATSFFQDCLVTNSNFRAYTVHGTNSSRLSRNVAYNVQGFAVYLEDGLEERNLIEYNLMAHVHPIYKPANGGFGQGGEQFYQNANLIVPADTSASGYYISNAYNDIVGNAASGGWSGFAFPNLYLPLGASLGKNYGFNNPSNRPTKSFVGNSAHSSGFYWQGHGAGFYVGAKFVYDSTKSLLYYDSGRNARSTTNSDGSTAVMIFNDTKVFAVNKGFAHWGNTVELYNFEAHDMGQPAAMLFGEAAIVNALIVGRTNNVPGWYWQQYGMGLSLVGFQFYDTWVKTILSRVTFRNFVNASQYAVRFMDHSDHYTPQGINAVKGLTFTNVTRANVVGIDHCGPTDCPGTTAVTMSSRIYAVWDTDGTFTLQSGNARILGSNLAWWNVDSTCTKDIDWRLWSCSWTTNRNIVFFNVDVQGLTGGCDNNTSPNLCTDQYSPYTVGYVTQFGKTKTDGVLLSPWSGVAGMSAIGWLWRAQLNYNGIVVDGAPSSFTVGDTFQMPRGDFVVLAIAYPANTQFTVNLYSTWWNITYPVIPMASSLSVVTTSQETLNDQSQFTCSGQWYDFCTNTGGAGLGAWYFDGTYFYLRVVAPNCYNRNTRATCQSGSMYTVDGVSVPRIMQGFRFQVTATCAGCAGTTRNGVTYYTVADTVPSPFTYSFGSARSVSTPVTKTLTQSCLSSLLSVSWVLSAILVMLLLIQ